MDSLYQFPVAALAMCVLAAGTSAPADTMLAYAYHHNYSGSPILIQVHIQSGNRTTQSVEQTFNLCDDAGAWDDLRLAVSGKHVASIYGLEEYRNSAYVAGTDARADVYGTGASIDCLSQGAAIGPSSTAYRIGGTLAMELRTDFGWSGTDGKWEGRTGYLGIRAENGAKAYYGWMKCQVPSFLTMSPWMRVYEWAMVSEDLGAVQAGVLPPPGSGTKSTSTDAFSMGSSPSDAFDQIEPGSAGSITIVDDPGDPGNGLLKLYHPDGSEPVSVSKGYITEPLLDLSFRYMFETDGKLEILLDGTPLDTIQAPAAGAGRDSFADFAQSYDLAGLGVSPGEHDLVLRLTNAGDPAFYLDDLEIVTQLPEPISAILLIAGGLALVRRRRG